jgi:hypothetical protein
MKYYLIIISFFFLSNCQSPKKESLHDALRVKDINDIVATIIKDDNLKVLKTESKTVMLLDSLKKTKIYVATKKDRELGIPPPPDFVSITRIVKIKINNQDFFSSKDSIYMLSQYPDIKKFKISDEILSKVNSTSFKKKRAKRKNSDEYDFYEIGIPLFSKDNNRAYVELSHYCGSLCGHGEAIFLEKIKGKWIIVDKIETWIS